MLPPAAPAEQSVKLNRWVQGLLYATQRMHLLLIQFKYISLHVTRMRFTTTDTKKNQVVRTDNEVAACLLLHLQSTNSSNLIQGKQSGSDF